MKRSNFKKLTINGLFVLFFSAGVGTAVGAVNYTSIWTGGCAPSPIAVGDSLTLTVPRTGPGTDYPNANNIFLRFETPPAGQKSNATADQYGINLTFSDAGTPGMVYLGKPTKVLPFESTSSPSHAQCSNSGMLGHCNTTASGGYMQVRIQYQSPVKEGAIIIQNDKSKVPITVCGV